MATGDEATTRSKLVAAITWRVCARTRASPSRPWNLAAALGLSLSLVVWFAPGVPAYGEPVGTAADACLAFAGEFSLGAALPRTSERLQSTKSLTIVAVGSSSTTGFGTLSSGGAFPDVMKHELSRRWPSVQIEVVNRGRIFENVADNFARLQTDVLRHKPDLVIWQLGTNDVVWRGVATNTKALLLSGVRQLKAADADVVLMDLQYAPLVRAWSRHSEMQRIIAEVAREENVGLFPRFLLMKRAIDAGVRGIVSWDGLHNSAAGYRCVGRALGQMIDAAVAK